MRRRLELHPRREDDGDYLSLFLHLYSDAIVCARFRLSIVNQSLENNVSQGTSCKCPCCVQGRVQISSIASRTLGMGLAAPNSWRLVSLKMRRMAFCKLVGLRWLLTSQLKATRKRRSLLSRCLGRKGVVSRQRQNLESTLTSPSVCAA